MRIFNAYGDHVLGRLFAKTNARVGAFSHDAGEAR
jgi:hypothetical protein